MTNQEQIYDWENADIIHRNKEKGHHVSIPYINAESALKGEKSPFVKSLDGLWKFLWMDKPSLRPKDFFKPEFPANLILLYVL